MTAAIRLDPHIATAPGFRSRAAFPAERRAGKELVRLDANENPLGPSPKALVAIRQSLSALHLYPPLGDRAFRELLAERVGEGLDAEHFVTAHGVSDLLALAALAFLDEGDEAIHCPPTYPVFRQVASRQGAVVIDVPREPEGYSYDVDAILRALTERTRLIYICNPNNPTGNALTKTQMARLVDGIPEHVLLISDECYHHYRERLNGPDTLGWVRRSKNVLVLHSFSKAYGLAGLRCGYGVLRADLADYLARMRGPFYLGSLTLAAASAALDDSEHVARGVEIVLRGRRRLYRDLAAAGEAVWPSEANFLLFQPRRGAAEEVAKRLQENGVLVRRMTSFGLPDHLRVTVGLPEQNDRFLAALVRS